MCVKFYVLVDFYLQPNDYRNGIKQTQSNNVFCRSRRFHSALLTYTKDCRLESLVNRSEISVLLFAESNSIFPYTVTSTRCTLPRYYMFFFPYNSETSYV